MTPTLVEIDRLFTVFARLVAHLDPHDTEGADWYVAQGLAFAVANNVPDPEHFASALALSVL